MKQQDKKQLRYIVFPSDLETITGRSGRVCRKLIALIKKEHGVEKNGLVTYKEAADYLRLPPKVILKAINGGIEVDTL